MVFSYGQSAFFPHHRQRFLRCLLLGLAACLPAAALRAATPQTITFPALADRITTDAAFTPGATASSGLAVTYSITSPAGVATVSGSTVTLSGTAGSVTVKASQAGNGTHDAAPDVCRSFIVGTAAQKFAKLATTAHGNHELAIKPDGTLWAWGSSAYGQHGDGGLPVWQSVPTKVGTATTWSSVACGENHTAALRSDGSLWTAGYNATGQLGSGSTTNRNTLTKVGSATWLAVSCGLNHTVALRNDNTLWACGDNQFGQLGINSTTTTQSTTLVQVGSVGTWTAVACGWNHTLALRSDGSLWAWGQGNGQVGDGSYTQRHAPVKIGSATNWSSISGGAYHSLALRGDGSLWGWGQNASGQLGDGTTSGGNSPVQAPGAATWAAISAGGFHSAGRRQDGTLWAWGANYVGQLGDGTDLQRATPTQAGTAPGGGILARPRATTVLAANGTVQGLGDHPGLVWSLDVRAAQFGGKDVPAAWKDLACGWQYFVAISTAGTLWSGGSDLYSQLGNGADRDSFKPVQISADTTWAQVSANESHAAAVRGDGTLWTWGGNGSGKLGDGTTTTRDVPVQVPGNTWTRVACGGHHTAALRGDGTLWAWGENGEGQVGDNSTTDHFSPVQVGTATDWAQVACGENFTLAVRTDGTLWAWGGNSGGRLGDGTTTTRYAPVKIGTDTNWQRVACGEAHALALRTNGTLWAWGANSQGQLGDGTTTTRTAPVQVGSATDWTSIAAGRDHSAATRQNGTLWTWGPNNYGQLGDGTYTTRTAPVQSGTATNWARPACQIYGTLGLRSDGTLWTIGTNSGAFTVLLNPYEPNSVWPPRAGQTLIFPALGGLTQGQPVTLAATASSGLPVTYTVVGPATLSGNVLTPTGAGAVTVAAYQNGSPAWHTAESLMQTVTAQGLTARESWRQTHFGTTANTGTAADSYDADHDGLPNLLEFAFGLSPTSGASASAQLPQPVHNHAAQTFTYTFTEPAGAAGSSLVYTASSSTSLAAGSWQNVPDTGTGTTHIFTVPTTGLTQVFLRLEVTAP